MKIHIVGEANSLTNSSRAKSDYKSKSDYKHSNKIESDQQKLVDSKQRQSSEYMPKKSFNFLTNIRNMLQVSSRSNEKTDDNLRDRALSERRQNEPEYPYQMKYQSIRMHDLGQSLDF